MDRLHRLICRSPEGRSVLDQLLATRRWTEERSPEGFLRRMTIGAGIVDGAYVLEWDADDELITTRLRPLAPALALEVGRCALLEEGPIATSYEEFDRAGRTLVWDDRGAFRSLAPAPSEQAWLDPEPEDLPDLLLFGRLDIDREMRSEDGTARWWTSDDRTWCHYVVDTGNADFFDDVLDQSYDEWVRLPGLGKLSFRDRTVFAPLPSLEEQLYEGRVVPIGDPIIDPVLEALAHGHDVRLGRHMIIGVERVGPSRDAPGRCAVVMDVDVNDEVDDDAVQYSHA